MRFVVVIVAFASLVGFTFAIPTSSVSTHSNDIDAEAENHRRDYFHNDDGGNADGDEIAQNTFQVPGTNNSLVLYLGTIGPRSAIIGVLNGTTQFIQSQLLASGDGQLPQDVDPFFYDLNRGAYFKAQSRKGQHLTWGILNNAAGWLFHHLGEGAAYRRECIFHIWDSQWGLVGDGTVTPGYSGKGIPQVVAGPDGITNYNS